ncbi:Uncharacterized membrane protein YsdA, DUF1294 family [Desulfonispora thiosulfatigenes DSM 11270]|uniref:Uncharacterized membrane protein YsdA, DUF1294 family n=1 Tax=Desulfonispora thiosulfatigenes DSM 11270 TaxID=656914 RepID=A0A1W1UV75_DESTI|nr:DUF1294 domain-containing protein [Desulfonispora thiosulfatigenes]SMB85045.1 Uncharacterized membrane protein YsdA, DUF1294 family [Desulfonispora thiosulfatigenes DSM 11270]
MHKYISYYLICINILAFIVSGLDKKAAIQHKRRVREKTLFYLALIGGSVGLIVSIYYFRHKTKHKSFTLGVPIIIIVQMLIIYYFYFL